MRVMTPTFEEYPIPALMEDALLQTFVNENRIVLVKGRRIIGVNKQVFIKNFEMQIL